MASETFETVSIRPGLIVPTNEVGGSASVLFDPTSDTIARDEDVGDHALRLARRWMALGKDYAINDDSRV